MSINLSDYRKSYEKGTLLEGAIPENPFELFTTWFTEVEKAGGVDEANAMTVASVGADGFPKSRIVLLKNFSKDGFVFYTNYNSEKGKAILTNPKVSVSFFWPNLERQVIIKGKAQKNAKEKSEAYFKQRPRGSQIGAWASNQSEPINSREVLSNRVKELQDKFKNQSIPMPEHWGGIIVVPQSIEFWQGRPNRLHDRMLYTLTDASWSHIRLAP